MASASPGSPDGPQTQNYLKRGFPCPQVTSPGQAPFSKNGFLSEADIKNFSHRENKTSRLILPTLSVEGIR